MALPVTISGIQTAVAPVGPFKVAAGTYSGVAINTAQATNTTAAMQGPGGSTVAHGQTFTNGGSSLTIPSVVWSLAKSGTPTDNVYCEIYSTDPNGTLLATSNNVASSTITATASPGTAITFTFASPPTISASATFAVVVRRTAFDSTNTILVPVLTSGGTYAGGVGWALAGTWSSFSGRDYQVAVNQTVTLATDAYYFFGRDATTATTLQAYKSTAPDTSWASIATVTGLDIETGSSIAGYQVGNVIHLTTGGGGSSAKNYHYHQFNAATDTFALNETIASALTITGQSAPAAQCSIVVRSTGEVVAFFQGTQTKTSGTFYARVYYSRRTAVNTWSAAVEVDANTAADNTSPIVVLGASDRLHFLWAAGSTTTQQRHLTGANVLGTAGVAASSSALPLDAVSINDSGTIRFVGFTENGAVIFRFASADNPTISGVTTTALGIPIRGADDNLNVYALYRASADSDLYVKTSTDFGATWSGAASAFVATVTGVDINLSKNQQIYQRGNNIVFPYVANDNGTLKYNEYVVRTLGPVNYPLTAVTGAFTLNGQANKLAYARDFNADAGAFALAGVPAVLRRGYTLAAVPGAFALSGKIAGLELSRAAATGSFTLSGQFAGLELKRAAATGAFVLSGQAAGTLASRFIRSTVTTYALTGIDATLTRTSSVVHRTMPAATGAFAVNGQAATLRRTYGVPHTTGTFALSGVDAAERAIRKMPAVVGAFTLGGQIAITRYGRVVLAVTGARLLTGVDAKLRYGHVVTAATGALVFTGQAVGLNYGAFKNILAQTGVFTLAGPVTKLAYGRLFTAAKGSIAFAGPPTTLRYGHATPAVKGTVTLGGVAAVLRVARNMVAVKGTVTLAGPPTTLRFARLMTAVKASFVLNGVAANLINSGAGPKTMPATSRAFVVTGVNAVLRRTAVFKSQVTTYTLSGPATVLDVDRYLRTSTGAIVLDGKPVVFIWTVPHDRVFVAATGTFRLEAPDTVLRLVKLFPPLPERGQPGTLEFGHRNVYLRRW